MRANTALVTCLCLAALALAGCRSGWSVDGRPDAGVVESKGLGLRVEVDRPRLAVGERLDVMVAVRNRTSRPMEIVADTGALVYLRLWRFDGLNWVEVRRYPQAATMVVTAWQLPAGGHRAWRLDLPVEPDWPSFEPLRLSAELNGRPDAVAYATVQVGGPPEAAR
jgi:hypothetical protein